MLSDETLRENVKKLKIYQNIPYKELAELLEIKTNSFYNWLKCQYTFSDARKLQLEDLINTLREE